MIHRRKLNHPPRITSKRARRTLAAALVRAKARADKPATERIEAILNGATF